MALFSSPLLQATTNYCGDSTPRSFIRVKNGNLNPAQLDTALPARGEITTSEFNSVRVLDSKQPFPDSIGFNFRYTIVDLESIDAMTNGHLHTWDFPLEGRLDGVNSEIFYSITPVLSVSSNALKNPQLINSDGLQLYTGLVYKKISSSGNAWLLGLRSDHRFGSYKAYPVVGICMYPASDWNLQLALPDFSILKRLNSQLSLKLFIQPAGTQWHVFSRDTMRESDFNYDATTTGLSTQWRFNASINVSLVIAKHTGRQFGFVLNDNTFVEAKAASSTGMMINAEVLF